MRMDICQVLVGFLGDAKRQCLEWWFQTPSFVKFHVEMIFLEEVGMIVLKESD